MVMRLDKLLANYGLKIEKNKNGYLKRFCKVNGMIIKKDDLKLTAKLMK